MKAILFDLYGTLCEATSPEMNLIEQLNLNPIIHDNLQIAVCGTIDEPINVYLDNIARVVGLEQTKYNRCFIRGVIDEEIEKGLANIPEKRDECLELLQKRGYELGLVTNCYHGTLERLIRGTGLDRFFSREKIVLSYKESRKEPLTKQTPKIYHLALERVGVDAENVVMVGDSLESDIIASKNATNGKIGGILISKNPSQETLEYAARNRVVIIPEFKQVPEAVEKYFKEIKEQTK